MDNDSKNSEGRLGPNLPNGTRLEKIHSIQLRITCPEVSKVTDWDLKQAIKKLEPQCSNPICERIERSSQEKSIVFHLAYEDFISPKRLSEKIDLLKGHIKVHAYTLNVVVFIEETEVLKKALHNSIWLENLPTRWLELDAYQCDCIIPKDHMLRKYLEHRFGEVVQMESRSRSDNSQLHCDICVKFASEIISMEAMKMLGYDRCVVRKEGFSAVFLINASIDMYGYLSPKAIAERSSSRECFHSAQSSLSLSLTDLIAQLDEADIFLKNLKDGSELDNLDSNSLIKKEYDNLLGTCGRGRFLIESSNNRKYLLHEISQIKNKCAEIKKIGAELSGQLSILKKCVALETKNRIDQERKIEYLTVKNHAKNDIFVSNEICDLGTEVCSKNGWTDIYDLLIPRARILSTTLSQLLKIEGGGSGGLKFLNVLQKSRTVLTRYIFEIKPIVDLIKIFGNHVEIIAKIEKDLNVNFLADNADIFDVAGKDENNVKEIDFHHNQSNNSCRNGKDDDNEDNSRSSEENSEEKKEINTANNDDDEDSNKKMMKNNSEPVYRIAVDSLKKVVKLSKFNLELLFSTIRNKSLNSDDFSSNSNNSSNNNNNNNKNDNSNNDNNNNSNSHNNDDEVICIMKNKINENGDKINNEIVNSDFCEEEYLHSITRTLDTLLKITKQLKGAESIANYCRTRQQDSTTTHITSKVELQNLHNYFLTEIIYPFDYRISRISVLLRSNTEILLEPSFLQGLKNSVETACTLLERGVNAYEEDKTELEREYARIIESDRLIEKERIKKIKDDNRKLLESKISLLKSRQRELEEERDKNDKKLKADIEARRREEEMKMNEVERSEEHFARKEEKHEVGNLRSHGNLNFFESKYDSRESRERNQKRSRHQDEDEGRDIDVEVEVDIDEYSTYSSDLTKELDERIHRHAEDGWRKELESGEVHRGDFIYSLQRPKWDAKRDYVSTAPPSDEMSSRTLHSARRLSSVVRCTDFERTDIKEGITSSTRKRKSERNQDQIQSKTQIPDSSQNEEFSHLLSTSSSSPPSLFSKSHSDHLLSNNLIFVDENEQKLEKVDDDNNYLKIGNYSDKDFELSVSDDVLPGSTISTTTTIINVVNNQKKNENHIREALLASRLKKKMLKLQAT